MSHASDEVLKKYGMTPEELLRLDKLDRAERARRERAGLPTGDAKRQLDAIEVDWAVKPITQTS